MTSARPTIYLITGCNGAGKTTFAKEFLPKEVKCLRFLNADELGGHHVPATDIRRRFHRSLAHLLADYLPLATRWAIWDSRGLPVKRLAISADHDIEFVRKLIGR